MRINPITSPGPCTICGEPADGLSFMGNPDGRSWQLCGSGPCWSKANRQSDKLEADYEITLDQKQLSMAAGNYCADVLKALPAGVYAQSQLSITTYPERGELAAVFRAWGPAKPIQPRQGRVTGVTSAAPTCPRCLEPVLLGQGHSVGSNGVPTHNSCPPAARGYEPTEEIDEP